MPVRRSTIGWTDYSGGDANFQIGCTPCSIGCANCYAKHIVERSGHDFSQIRIYPDKLKRLVKTKFTEGEVPFRRGKGSRPLVFICDLGDLFHLSVPDDFIWEAFRVMGERDDIDWQVLTKRIEHAADFFQSHDLRVPPNIWVGTTAENQKCADERIPILLQIPAAKRFVSVEPMLAPIDLREWMWDGVDRDDHPKYKRYEYPTGAINLVICGAESGSDRRPFDVKWAEDLYHQCKDAGVAYFGKQDSALYPGKPLLIDGREIKEFPQ